MSNKFLCVCFLIMFSTFNFSFFYNVELISMLIFINNNIIFIVVNSMKSI